MRNFSQLVEARTSHGSPSDQLNQFTHKHPKVFHPVPRYASLRYLNEGRVE